jgi:hypothetical protein
VVNRAASAASTARDFLQPEAARADGRRLVGFDNAHAPSVGAARSRGGALDHWHRDEDDGGRPYRSRSAVGLIEDFLREVEGALAARGVWMSGSMVKE